MLFFFSSRRRHTRLQGDWSSDVCSSDLPIRKNKTFWFADYEGLRVRQATPWVATVPTAVEQASGYNDFWGLITGQNGTPRTDLLRRTFSLAGPFAPSTPPPLLPGKVGTVSRPEGVRDRNGPSRKK